ncbi:MAG: pectin acetylesterase-family hydrolase [Minicystis sp.]
MTATANQWTWVPVAGAKCRNGSATGFGVRINPASTKLFIYLEGGGACFNPISCIGNPSSYGSTNFNSWKTGGGTTGIFDTTNPANPVKDWSAVYIPYCTGDVHGGDASGVNVPGTGGPQNQEFVGFANVGLYMSRIVPTFPGVTEVLLTGVSAGGFGALYNYDRVARDFCPVPVVLVDDSGPPMSDTYLAPCLQNRWRTLWGLNGTLPADCPEATGPNGGGIVNAVTCLGTKYGTGRLGLISSDKDSTISQFYGFGQNNCANIDGIAGALPGATYAAGLNELRSVYLSQSPAWGTYFVSSTTHTYLGGNGYYNTTVMNVKLTSWLADLVNGGPIADVGP